VQPLTIPIKRLDPSIILPEKKTPGAAAYDVRAWLGQPLVLNPGERHAIPTGLIMEIPEGFLISVRPRSGLAIEHGITMINAPGTIDSDFRGELKILTINLGDKPYTIENGDRIAQLLLERSLPLEWEEGEPGKSTRGENGFGSTGIR